MIIPRKLFDVLLQEEQSILLLGPRQVGKSTLLRWCHPDLEVNLNHMQSYLAFQKDPSLLGEQIALLQDQKKANPHKPLIVFIDEIQKCPMLLDEIQVLIDKDKFNALNTHQKPQLKFLISGSSARKLKRGHANLLPGRIIVYTLSGVSLLEIDKKDSLKKTQKLHMMNWVESGFLPGILSNPDLKNQANSLDTYVSTYLKEEILEEALTRNIQGFTDFLMTLASSSGLPFDLSKASSKSKIPRSTAKRFLEILEDTLLIFQVNAVKLDFLGEKTLHHPKVFFFDSGILRGIQRLQSGFGLPDVPTGLWFEHLVAIQIMNTAKALGQKVDIQYYRTHAGAEVDFVVFLKKPSLAQQDIWAVEVKTAFPIPKDAKHLRDLMHKIPSIKGCFVTAEPLSTELLEPWDCASIPVYSLMGLLKALFEK